MITIAAYEELDALVAAFDRDQLNLLIICSAGGLGKSETVRRALSGHHVTISGHETPLDLYRKLYEGRDRPIVFDEIDGLLLKSANVGLLKQVCETAPVKRVQWGSTDRRAVEIDGGMGHFFTESRVCVLCNSFQVSNANVSALKSRGLTVQFVPSSQQVFDRLLTFASDAEIIEFLRTTHESIREFSLRTYCILEDLKRAGLDWRKYALQETDVPPKVIEIADLLERYNRDVDRIRQYSGCRRDYYNWKQRATEFLARQRHALLKPAFLCSEEEMPYDGRTDVAAQ